jgi:hypothetical protein
MTRLLFLACAMSFLTSTTHHAGIHARQTAQAWRVGLPLIGRLRLRLKVATLIRVATSRWGLWLLGGRTLRTRWGTVQASATQVGRALDLRCSWCLGRSSAIDRTAALNLDIILRITRQGNRLSGELIVNGLVVQFAGTLSDEGIQGDLAWSDLPVRDVYDLFASAIPELRQAHIMGTIAARGRFSLPEGKLGLNPELSGFVVRGLGTERLAWDQFRYRCASVSEGAPVCRGGEQVEDWLALRDLGRWLPRAVVAAEDIRFFHHPGYDLIEAIAALQSDRDPRQFRRGGSTLTQQLAGSLFLSTERTLVRTLRETLYAVEMERTLGKRRILALYLNTVEWGPGIRGARQAARTYFGKEPGDLRPEEAAWLAAILRNPRSAWASEYITGTPDLERVAWVVGRMKGLNPVERRLAFTRPLQFTTRRPGASPEAGTRAEDVRSVIPSKLTAVPAGVERD